MSQAPLNTISAAQLSLLQMALGTIDPSGQQALLAYVCDQLGVARANNLPNGVMMLPGGNPTGAVTTGATTVAEEHGDALWHVTKLTLTAFALGNSGSSAALAIGAKFYSLPAGSIEISQASIVGGFTAAVTTTAQTPQVGIGTVIASGAAAVLSGTATFEDVIPGGSSNNSAGSDSTAPDVAGTTLYKSAGSRLPVIIKATGGKSHDLFLNTAVAWADAGVGAVTFTGTITLKWRKLD